MVAFSGFASAHSLQVQPTEMYIMSSGPIWTMSVGGLGAGSTTGGIVGALVGMGIPEYEAKRYDGPRKERRHSGVRPLR
jgi:ABC-type branched-subunit amino acid transport system permease subunit